MRPHWQAFRKRWTLRSQSGAEIPLHPRNANFREEVLKSRGIIIKGNTLSLPDPYIHFATGRTAETSYRELPGFENLQVWLETDTEFLQGVSEEYPCMVHNSLCEAEFATFANEQLLKSEPRRFTIPEDRRWRTERMIELVAKPSSREGWEAPPILHPHDNIQSYNFDIRPDCAYWLSFGLSTKTGGTELKNISLSCATESHVPTSQSNSSGMILETLWQRIRSPRLAQLLYAIDTYYSRHVFVRPKVYGEIKIRPIFDIMASLLEDPNLHCGALNQCFRRTESGMAVPCRAFSGANAIRSAGLGGSFSG
jgi:hypothetical protein